MTPLRRGKRPFQFLILSSILLAGLAYTNLSASDGWNAYLAVSIDALEASPTFATVAVNEPDDPVARGVCASNGEILAPWRPYLGDFIDVVIGPQGRPWAAFVDACSQTCAANNGRPDDDKILVGSLAGRQR